MNFLSKVSEVDATAFGVTDEIKVAERRKLLARGHRVIVRMYSMVHRIEIKLI